MEERELTELENSSAATTSACDESENLLRVHEFAYDGEGKELFQLYLKNIILTVLTLGIYRFWAKVQITRFHYQHTQFSDGRFDYHATGAEKLKGFLKGMFLLLLAIAVLVGVGMAAAEFIGSETAFLLCFYGFFLILFMLRPLIIVGSRSYNLSRTSWNNLRFRFNGTVRELYKIYVRDTVYIIFTLGIYGIWHQTNVRRYTTRMSYFGDTHFEYSGQGRELLNLYLGGILLCYITLGLYSPWLIAKLHRYLRWFK